MSPDIWEPVGRGEWLSRDMNKNGKSRPRITIQAAQTLDGKISLPQKRTLLSSKEGLELAHRTRAEHDAVLVGSSTVRIDDPALSVRYCSGPQPRRIVLATSLDIPISARVLAPGPGLLVIGGVGRASLAQAQLLRQAGAEVRLVNCSEDNLVSMREALAVIYHWGVRRLLVEGGARILTTFFRERLVDEVMLEIVPILLGNPSLSAVANIGVGNLDDAPKLKVICVKQLGTSIWVQGHVERSSATEP